MFIHEMTEMACRQALAKAGFGRLGCARDNKPYVVPIYFVYDDDHLYGFTTLGQKVEWMRSNPYVCVEIDERISHERWMSVIVFGRYEELLDIPENEGIRSRAQDLLQRKVMWWEPAYISQKHRDQPHSLTPIFYRIHIQQMTGHRATSDKCDGAAALATPASAVKRGWLDRLLHPLP